MKRLFLIVEFTTGPEQDAAPSIESTVNLIGSQISKYAREMDEGEEYGTVDRFQLLVPIPIE